MGAGGWQQRARAAAGAAHAAHTARPRPRAGKDYYKILGVEKDANEDAIKKAYRK
jgi:DnaJ-domain-containing protein 1